MTREQCPVCSSSNLEEIIALDEYPFAGNGSIQAEKSDDVPVDTLAIGICHVCGLIFQMDPVTIEQLDEMLLKQPLPLSIEDTGMEINETKKFISNLKRYTATKGKALDIGCGSGYLLGQLAEIGYDVVGVDAHPESVRMAKEAGFNVLEGRFEEGMFKEGTFDLIVVRSVLEHTIEPATILSVMYKILKPGGILAIEVPDNGRVFKRSAFGGFASHHVNYFTIPSLTYALSMQGFEQLGGYEEAYVARFMKKPLKGEIEGELIHTADEEVEEIVENLDAFLDRKEEIAQDLADLIEEKFPRGIIILGAGTPTVDLLYYTGLHDEIVAVVSSDKSRIGSYIAGSDFEVRGLDELDKFEFDAILVSSERRQEELVGLLKNYRMSGGQVIRFTPDIEVI